MNCLNNRVGIWDGCSAREDKLYINDLPGFDMRWIDLLAKEQNISGMEVLESIRNRSGVFLKNEINAFLNPRADVGSVLSNEVAGYVQDNKVIKALEASKYKGLQVSLSGYPYLSIFVDRISLFLSNSTTTDIKVFDLLQGIELDAFSITTVAGTITTIEVGKEYKNKGQSLSLGFVIDSSLSDAYYVSASARSCHSCYPRLEKVGAFCSGRGIQFDQSAIPLENTVSGLGHTNGITVHYSVQCDHDYWICNMASRFDLAMYYRCGVETCEELLFMDSLNSLNTIGLDKIQALQNKCLAGYNEQMSIVLKNLRIPNNLCYSCTPLIKNNTRVP